MTGNRRTVGLLALTVSVVVLGVAGITLAATAQGDTIPEPSPSGSSPGSVIASPPLPPTGSFRLSASYLWPGQTTTLIQTGLTPHGREVENLVQIIDWGDGTTQTVPARIRNIAHQYRELGTHGVSVLISDGGQRGVAVLKPRDVQVDTSTSIFRLRDTSSWTGRPVVLRHGESSDTDTVRIAWGDGTTSTVKASVPEVLITHTYAKAGTFTVKGAAVGEFGAETPKTAGTITVRGDMTRPVAGLSKPAAPAKGKSWATVRGTASDAASGVRNVAFTVIEKRGAAWYHWTGSGWKKSAGLAAATKAAKVFTLTPTAAGAWSTKLTGVQKGTLRFTWSALDRAGNRSVGKTLDQKITS